LKFSSLVLLFYFTGFLFAQDHLSPRNGIGWNNGISYRRYLSDNLWLGFVISGDASSTKQKDTTVSTSYDMLLDSTSGSYTYNSDTTFYYSGAIKMEIGKRIFHCNPIELNTILFISYTYQNSKRLDGGTSSRNTSRPRNTVSGGIGLEPMVYITKSLSIGTDFGIQYYYTFGKDNSSYTNDNAMSTYRSSTSGDYSKQEIKSFGSFSLSTGLIGFIWF
jgi:hypothetical protein